MPLRKSTRPPLKPRDVPRPLSSTAGERAARPGDLDAERGETHCRLRVPDPSLGPRTTPRVLQVLGPVRNRRELAFILCKEGSTLRKSLAGC